MDTPIYFPYGETETSYLISKDPVLGAVIEQIGHISRPVISDLFEALLHAVVGQQISSKAHATVWGRMQDRFSPLTPEHIARIPAGDLQSCGITMKKATYIKEISARILDGRFDLGILPTLPDGEVCARLSALPGIGVWTAEMLMTFSMLRPDIISCGDLAILRGLRMVYRHRKITPALFNKYKRRYSPYATVASLYLWAAAAGTAPGLHDPGTTAKKKPAHRERPQTD